jgi:tetratricopeptide (TPR) repeat protein
LNLISLIKKSDGQYEEALATLKEAVEIATKANNQTKICEYSISIGDIYVKLAKFSLAETTYNKALALR